MDFPGGANTNIHLIDGFSNIYWRIYTEEAGITNNPQEGPANGYTILKHLGRLKDLEARLRLQNCLASCPRRLGLWVFSPTPDFESLNPLYARAKDAESNKIVVGTTTLKVSASGSVSSQELVKGLSSDGLNQSSTQPSAQPRPTQGQQSSRRQDGYSSSAAIYASFISAVTGAISLQLIRHHGALPLGSRTLFTAVENLGYESPRINNDSILSTSCLTTLNIQLTMGGTITVSTQTISQPGIMRLCNSRDDSTAKPTARVGTDVWLCPNGTIARFVAPSVELSTVSTPAHSAQGNLSAKQTQWKLDVVQWLRNFGMHVESVDEEPWVEVEVWEPFFARLAGEAWRQNDDSQSTLPLKRMLWPARFCFKRASSSKSSRAQFPLLDDPLDFAEQWSTITSSLKIDHVVNPAQNTPIAQEAPHRDHELPPSPKVESTETIESLSRIAQYPDLQTANLVYPTPPDGAAATGLNNPNPPEVFADDSDFGHSRVQQNSRRIAPGSQSPPIQSDGVDVGTGRYDESDEEDLFGEMNERDFGSKGITDADFSFFDDPDFDGMGIDGPEEDLPQNIPAPHDKPYSEAEGMVDEYPSLNQSPEITNKVESQEEHTPLVHDTAPQSSEQQMEPEEPVHQPTTREGQTISPPLSPIEVKKILFPAPQPADQNQSTRYPNQGHYSPVAFEKRLGDWDRKYGAAGRFWFSTGGPPERSDQTSAIPTIGIPHRGRSGAKALGSSKDPHATGLPLAKAEQGLRSTSVSSASSDDSVGMSEDHAPTPITVPTIPSLKRKRAPSDSEVLSVASPEKALTGNEAPPANATENSTFLGNFLANFSDWTLTGYFSAFTPQQLPVLVRREDQLQIAQLLVDQITQSSLKHPLDGRIGLFDLESEFPSLEALGGTNLLGDPSRLDFKRYTALQDEFSARQPQQQPPQHPTPPQDVPKSFISRLPAPHVRVRRGKEYLEALPPAVSFWETFGLEPAHGAKDISAYCIYPAAALKAADMFLSRFGLLYPSCSLGTHTRGECSLAFEDGLRVWQSETSSYESMMQTLKGICEELGSDLSQSTPTTENCVIYIINPFKHAAALADICSAFWHLFQQLVPDAERRHTRPVNELILQIIPLEFVMSPETMVVPPQSDFLNLALEVYSRCRPMDVDLNPLLCAPPILLADPLPRAISFRLASERASPLQDGRSLHIACSKSLDQRWVSVAWSDVPGSVQKTMSYCLRYRQSGGASRPMSEVRQEIWTTTKHIMEKLQARWKVQLVTTEPMEPDEAEAWANLADQYNKSRPGSLELTILSVNVIPDLILEPPSSAVSMAMFNSLSSSTPVSTPNPSASVASPEQSGNAATPTSGPAAYSAPTPTDMSLETDSEAVLTDICDESWLAILSHRLNSSPHLTEFRPALSSGYLLRRKGATDADGVFAMSVNLIYSPRPTASHDNVLKDTLSMYRDLGCLARAKGICSVQNNTLPWHIVTALRAQELLSYVF